MKKDCLQCGKEYEAKRSSSKFCGAMWSNVEQSVEAYFAITKLVQDKLLSVQKAKERS